MIDIFIPQVEEMGEDMQRFLDSGDFESLGKLAHKAKSSVSIMGMSRQTSALKNLETDCQERVNIGSYQAAIDSFRRDCLSASAELNEYRKTLLNR